MGVRSQAQNLVVESLTPLFCLMDLLYHFCLIFSIFPSSSSELNSKTSLVQSIDAGTLSTSTYQSLQEACQHIVDNVLTNKEGTFFFVFFRYGSDVMMIAQKYQWDDNYGAYLAFGYELNDLVYQNKMSGEWK